MKKVILSFVLLLIYNIAYPSDNISSRANDNQIIYDESTIDNFISYIQTLKSVSIEFLQTDVLGNSAEGILLINKPFKFRCNYYPPFPILIVGNKKFVTIYDYEMENTTYIDTNENIFNFLMVNGIDLKKHFDVQIAKSDDNISIIQLKHEASDRVVDIIFNKTKNMLEEIKVYENDNVVTLRLKKIEHVKKFNDRLFEFKNPEVFGTPDHLYKEQINELIELK